VSEGVKAPEYTEKVDVYAFGIILWEMISRKHPFEEFRIKFFSQLDTQIKKGLRPTIPKHFVCITILHSC
jgi:serine/threonine protein kinase